MASAPSFTSSSTVTNPRIANQVRSWVRVAAANSGSDTKPFHRSLATTASYVTVGVFTMVTITSLFCLFMAMTVLDDVMRIAGPRRLWDATKAQRERLHLDWASVADRASVQLNSFAAWERRKRAEWVTPSEQAEDDDPFHNLVVAVSNYLNDYVRHSRRQSKSS